MTRVTFKVLFYIKRTRVLKDGTVPVYVRVTVNGKRAEFRAQRSIDPKQWDSKKGCARGYSKAANDLNSHFDLIKAQLQQHKMVLSEQGKMITAESLKNAYLGLDEDSKTILEVFQEHNDRCKGLVNIDFAPGTYKRYETCYRHVERFIKSKYKKNDLELYEITPRFVKDFEFYLKVERKCNHNSATKYLKNFKKITRIAQANGWLKTDPYSNIKFHLEEVDMDFLNEEELTRMIEQNFEMDRLQQVKDVYLFCCFTGLAFVDVKSLIYDDIVEVGGKRWIKKKRQKTKNWCNIPLLGPAEQLVDKYKDHPICQINKTVFPVLSNQKMNAYLKEIANVCGIKKKLSTHTARHTFATTVTLANQISIEVVSKMLGHSSISMTKKYARVVDDLISRDMQKIYSKYEGLRIK